ncbi:MAG: Na/Pi symporter [Sulfurimonas sp.]
MLKSIFLPLTFLVLGYGFWISANFKEVSAGVAIFLLGMMALEFGFKSLSGGILETILKNSTDKLYKSLGFGIISTTIMQSSSLVSILTISFLGVGLITLSQGIGIIFGANIGTTTGTWLIAGLGLKVDIAAYAMPILVFGVILIFQKGATLKAVGFVLTGLGFLFLGIAYMKEGFEAYKSTIDLSLFAMGGMKGLFIFTAIGIFSTVVMQSSHASLVLIITALAAGQISYENALALAIGANIGTTVTAIIGAMSSNVDGKRLAAAHFIFNILTALIAIIFIHQITYLVDFIANELSIANDDYTLKLAIFHTIFNTGGVLIMLPFINNLITFLKVIIKEGASKDKLGYDSVKYLNNSALELPSTAMRAIINETKHLYENSFEIIAHGLNLKKSNIISEMELSEVINQIYSKKYVDIDALYHQKIKNIYGEIIDFATKAQANMKHEDIQELYRIKLANRELVEAIKDTKHLQKNLIKYSTHPNKHIKEQYANIKKGLAELLRTINIVANSNNEEAITQLLSSAKINTERYDIMANGTLDNLIRNHLITNEMATSLMNDSTYAYNISKNLISMAESLFIEKKSDAKNLHEDIITGD